MSFRMTMAALMCVTISFGLPLAASHAAEPIKIVVFDAELVDTSTEGEMFGENPAEIARLVLISNRFREGLQDSGRYIVVDFAAAQEQLSELENTVAYLHDCNNCELDIARALGAEQSAVVWVQKVSNLILNLNLIIKDVETAEIVNKAFVDIRGNTDRSWEHGANYMLKNRVLAD